jgi:hypothetical protein
MTIDKLLVSLACLLKKKKNLSLCCSVAKPLKTRLARWRLGGLPFATFTFLFLFNYIAINLNKNS